MTTLERAILALAQHEETHGKEAGLNPFRTVEDVRRYPVDYARYLAGVRAVIAAIREPSEGMIEAGEATDQMPGIQAPHADTPPELVWPAMIDALLSEEGW